MLYKLSKKGMGDIILAGFFLILVLFVIFLFSKIHTINLESNYEINQYKVQLNTLFQVESVLTSCYGYPVKITTSNLDNCSSLESIDFKIEEIENGICEKKTIIENGEKTRVSQNILIPIIDDDTEFNCPAKLIVYFDDDLRD